MDDPIDKKIEQANEQLKKKGTRVVIYRRGNKLWLRGTCRPSRTLTFPAIGLVGDRNQSIRDQGSSFRRPPVCRW
jgi:hypothetical protein